MISMSEHYIIIGKHEIGESVEKLLSIYRKCGQIETLADHAFKIHNASELDQRSTFDALEKAIDADFPDDCAGCGNQPEDCDCEDEFPNAKTSGPTHE